AILHQLFHDYAHDPFARGAYSYSRVHGLGAADVLARPLADKVFLAGEVTDAEYEGSVAGALASGSRAARQVLDVERTHAAFAAS
ncbi:MAG TPA: FAD-dependent oxidoreductase, partial [Kofleriaceae bacterium]|nr:FAD-dependent oxidoreductase [Kofleriaceae bacterium]